MPVPSHSVNGDARETVSYMMPSSRVCSQLGTGSSGVMSQVWGLLSTFLHGPVKCLSHAEPVPGSILTLVWKA